MTDDQLKNTKEPSAQIPDCEVITIEDDADDENVGRNLKSTTEPPKHIRHIKLSNASPSVNAQSSKTTTPKSIRASRTRCAKGFFRTKPATPGRRLSKKKSMTPKTPATTKSGIVEDGIIGMKVRTPGRTPDRN